MFLFLLRLEVEIQENMGVNLANSVRVGGELSLCDDRTVVKENFVNVSHEVICEKSYSLF
jgi:hypothetical protein